MENGWQGVRSDSFHSSVIHAKLLSFLLLHKCTYSLIFLSLSFLFYPQVSLRELTLCGLPGIVRQSLLAKGSRGLQSLFTGSITMFVAQVGSIIIPSGNTTDLAHLFHAINAYFNTDITASFQHSFLTLPDDWLATKRPFEDMGFTGHQLGYGLKDSMPFAYVRTFNLNSFHLSGFRDYPLHISLQDVLE